MSNLGVMKSSEKYLIHSVEKACDILLSYNEGNLEYGITELSKKLDLTKSTVHKLLITLEHKGLVVQNQENGKYSLSVRIFELASYYLNKIDVHATVKPHMEELAEEFKETVHFGVLDENQVVYIEKIEGKQSVNIYSKIGRRSPLHCVGVGKAILANLPQERFEEIVNQDLAKYTNHTITEPLKLERELNRIRENGYAIDDEEYEEGIRCVAAPVKNLEGKLIGAMSVTGPANRMTNEKLHDIASVLLENVKAISIKLGSNRL